MGNYRLKRDKKLAKIVRATMRDLNRLNRELGSVREEYPSSEYYSNNVANARCSINDAGIYLYRVWRYLKGKVDSNDKQ